MSVVYLLDSEDARQVVQTLQPTFDDASSQHPIWELIELYAQNWEVGHHMELAA